MPANRKPKAWNLNPQMTAAPELWRGNTEVVAFQEGAGLPMVTTAAGIIIPHTVKGTPEWNYGPKGREYRTSKASSESFVYNSRVLQKVSDYAYTVLLAVRDANADHGISGSSGSTSFRTFLVWWNGSGRSFRYRIWDGAEKDIRGTTIFSTDEYHIGTVVHDSEGVKLYVDGVLEDSQAASDAQSVSTDDLEIGEGRPTGSEYSDGNFVLFIAHDYAPTPKEIERLHADPFAMCLPAGF